MEKYNIFFKIDVIYKIIEIFFQNVIKLILDISQTQTETNDTSFDAPWSSLPTVCSLNSHTNRLNIKN